MSDRTEGLRGSFKIARLSGIGVFIHWSFFLLLLYFLYTEMSGGASLTEALYTVFFVLVVFVCVVLHEMGHALMARRFGIKTRDINLLPIGGVARLERMPRIPKQEFLIALAGPAVNVIIALAVASLMLILGYSFGISTEPSQSAFPGTQSFFVNLLYVNIILVVFNFIPAFPMDGGRVLRSALASRMPYARATSIAATVGKVLAFGFVVLAVYFGQPMLGLIGVFIFFGASSEDRASRLQVNDRSAGMPLSGLIDRDFLLVNSLAGTKSAVEAAGAVGVDILVGVDQEGKLNGILDLHAMKNDLLNTEFSQETPINQLPVYVRLYEALNLQSSLDLARFLFQQVPVRALPVIYEGTVIGVLKRDRVF